MEIARATEEDVEIAFDLHSLLNGIDYGHFPEVDDEWPDFDESSKDDLHKFYQLVMENFRKRPSGLMRVLFAASCAMDERNMLFDPKSDHLAFHPRIEETQKQRDMLYNTNVDMKDAMETASALIAEGNPDKASVWLCGALAKAEAGEE